MHVAHLATVKVSRHHVQRRSIVSTWLPGEIRSVARIQGTRLAADRSCGYPFKNSTRGKGSRYPIKAALGVNRACTAFFVLPPLTFCVENKGSRSY